MSAAPSAPPRIRVLVVDDHSLLRKGLTHLLQTEPDVEVVGEAADGLEAIAQAAVLRPDVILMDVRMLRVTGPEATRRILEIIPEAKIAILTVAGDEDGLFEAVKSGARGYLLKTIEPPALFEALRGVVRGEAPLATGLAAKLLGEFARQAQRPAAPGPCPELSRREQEIMALVAEGKTNKEIATGLGLGENTVKNHLKHLLAALHLENRVQIAVFACSQQGGGPAGDATGTAAREC